MKNEKAVSAERREELARWERRCRKIQHGLRIAMMVMVLFTGVMTMAFADPLTPITKLCEFIGNAIKASGKTDIIGVGFDKSDAIMNLINDGYLLCTMAQNPDVMGYEGVKAAVAAINGEDLGGKVTDTGVSVLTKE